MEGLYICFVLEVAVNVNPSTLLTVLQLFSVYFSSLKSLLMMTPDLTPDLLLTTVDWTCYVATHVVANAHY